MSGSALSLDFPSVHGKEVTARFDGGDITSDSGLLLLSGADRKIGLLEALSSAIHDRRQASKVTHDLSTLLRERVFAIAAGYEDANDLDVLRSDPALKLACGRAPVSDADLASQPTLCRLENGVSKRDLLRMGLALGSRVVCQLPADTRRVVLDLDEMADPCHGQQELELFNGHYDCYCYLPLLLHITDETGRQRLLAVLLRSGKSGTAGVRGLLKRAVGLLRSRFPDIEIVLRADAGYGNDHVLRCCGRLQIGYVLGMRGNERLHDLSTAVQMDACLKYSQLKYLPVPPACREYGSFEYKAGSWDKIRTMIVKAEITMLPNRDIKLNPRFVVTDQDFANPEAGYKFYCARGDQENRIKEFELDLLGGRTSCHRFLANQFRVLLHAAAAVLMSVIQEAAQTTCWANAQVATLRLRLLKVGARVVETTRRVWIHLSSSYPNQHAWQTISQALSG
jgi:hypothetical protein